MDLQKWMDQAGLSDQDLADQIGLTRGYISRIRRGLVHISLGTALELQAATRSEIALNMLLPLRLRTQAKRKAAATQPKPRPKPPVSKPPRPAPLPPAAAKRKRGKKAADAVAA